MKTNLRRTLSSIIVSCLLLSSLGMSVSAETSASSDSVASPENTVIEFQAEAIPIIGALSSSDINDCFALAQSTLCKYYRSKINLVEDENAIADFSNDLSSANLNTYITAKINSYRQLESDVLHSSFSPSFELVDWNVVNGTIHLTVAAKVVQPYDGFENESEFGELVQFIFVKKGTAIKIADWYSEDGYDVNARGLDIQLSDYTFWENSSNTSLVANSFNQINSRIQQNVSTPVLSFSSSSSLMQSPVLDASALNSFSRSSMSTYAKNNCSKSLPSAGSSLASYYDFATIPGSYDCTNFVSHVLLSGGSSVYNTSGGTNGIYSTGWFFANIDRRSSSWSGVSNLYSFLVNNTAKGPKGSATVYDTANLLNYYNFVTCSNYIGDIIQIDYSNYSSSYDHSVVISSFATNVSGNAEPLITSRTSSGSYNKDILLRTHPSYSSATSVRVIHLDGYYS